MTHPILLIPLRKQLPRWPLIALLSVGLWAGSGNASGQESAASAIDAAPYRDTKALQDLANLDDVQLQGRLSADFPRIQQTLRAFFPATLDVRRRSHGFAGAEQACLRTRAAIPCRLHMNDLIELNREKEQRSRILMNPFGTARQ
jgi:hypothetical protein